MEQIETLIWAIKVGFGFMTLGLGALGTMMLYLHGSLKSDLNSLKGDLNSLKQEVSELSKEVKDIDRRLCRIEGAMMNKECCMLTSNSKQKAE